jgi:hypothetical protein
MEKYTLDEAISKLNSGDLMWIDMINVKTLDFEICLCVADLAEFRAKNADFKDEDFLYTHFTAFAFSSLSDLRSLIEEIGCHD